VAQTDTAPFKSAAAASALGFFGGFIEINTLTMIIPKKRVISHIQITPGIQII